MFRKPRPARPPERALTPLTIAAIYAALGGLWILLSDRLLAALVSDPRVLTRLQTYKGWFYVLITALFLYGLMRRMLVSLRQSEAELREGRDLLQAVFDATTDGIFLRDTQGRYVLVNAAVERFFGRPAAEIIGRTDADLLPLEAGRFVRAADQHVLESGTSETREGRIVMGGEERIFLANLGVHHDARGRAAGVVGVVREITEKQKQEESLRRSEERYRLLFENSPLPMYFVDPDTLRILAANKAALLQYGYSLEEFLGLKITEIRPPEDLEQFEAFMETHRDAPVRSVSWVHRRKDGSTFDVEVLSHEVTFEGRPARFVLATDISERKRAEESLKKGHELLQIVARATNDAVWDWDISTGRLWWNEAFKTLFGYAKNEFEETIDFWSGIVHPEDRARVEGNLRHALEGSGSYWSSAYRLRRADGAYAHVFDRGFVMRDESGRATRMIGAMVDITRIKQSEEALRASEARLQQAEKMQAVGRLAGGVAHDFNNILMAINGYTEAILARHGLEADLRREVEEIRKAGERAASLTRQLLAFGRRQVLQPRVIDLNHVVQGIEPLVRQLIGEEMELVVRLAPDLGRVRADPGQMERVVVNLALNARDAMARGGRLVIDTDNVVLDREETGRHGTIAPGTYVRLSVHDTGEGMSPEIQSRLFEPFFSTKPQGRGTGLGLATVYGVVSQSRGQIQVTSEPGAGSTFRIYLPRVEAPSEAVDASATARRAPERGSETILLVEDEDGVRDLLTDLLEASGYTVLAAGSGTEALRTAADHTGPIHMVVTDLSMPGMGGQELTRWLLAARPGLKVLYMSGYVGDAVTDDGGPSEGVAFLEKPFPSKELVARIRELLDR